MRILHLDSGREMRGGQWQALRLHRGLLERGHKSLLLARRGSRLLEAPESGILRATFLSGVSRDFDLIHAHDARSHALAALVSRIPLVVSRRVAFPISTTVQSRWKYNRAALFLAVSNYVAEILMQAGVGENRIAVVYDGVPVPPESALPENLIAFDKGTNLASEAARLAGMDVRIASNLAADLPRSRGLLYLTQSEGLGSGILLAMAHGVPVVASNTGGIPELIRHGENGLLTENNPAAVSAALTQMHRGLGKAAREAVLARFTVEHMVEATLGAYRRVLANG